MYASQNSNVTGRQTNHRPRPHRPAARGRKPAIEGLESRLLLSNTVVGYPLPEPAGTQRVSGGIALGSDGGFWFLVSNTTSGSAVPTGIERFDPTTHAYTAFPFSDPVPANSVDIVQSTELASGPDGNIWFTLPDTSRVGRFDITTDAFTLFTTPTAGSEPEFITAGPDGALWFTELTTDQIGRIDATTGAITEYVVPQPPDIPAGDSVNYLFQGITAGADGGIWFTEPSTAQIGRIDPATKAVTELDIPGSAQALAITAGPDGNLWFPVATGMGEVDLANDTVTVVAAPNGLAAPGVAFTASRSIAVGSDGALWLDADNAFSVATEIRFDPQSKEFSAVQSNVAQADAQKHLIAAPGAIIYGLDTGATTNGIGSKSQNIDAVIPSLATTTLLTASPSGTTLGQYVTFTAVVSPTNPVPPVTDPFGGLVTLMVDGHVATPYGEVQPVELAMMNGQEVATFEVEDLTVGDHDVVADYAGSEAYTGYAASDSAHLEFTVGVVPTHTTMEEYPSTADPGQPVSFQAFVGDTNPNGTVVPDQFDGSITFTVNGVAQPPIALSLNEDEASAATLTLTTLGSGDHFVTAAYGGSATFGSSSTAQPSEVTITGPALATTTTTLTASTTTADLGQPVTLTAIVAASGQGTPTGDVTFSVDGITQTPAALSVVNGQDMATLTLSTLTTGEHVVTAAYGGDASSAASTSSAVDVTTNAPALNDTATTLTRSPSTAGLFSGQLVTFTAIVSDPDMSADDSAIAGGSVAFTIDGYAVRSEDLQWLDGGSVATFATSALPLGYHTVQAEYSGAGRFAPSVSGSVGALIEASSATPAPTTTTLSPPQGTAVVGQPLSFTAIVGPQDSSVDPSSLAGDSVMFAIDGGAPVTVPLQSVGGQEVATLTTSSLAAGPHTVTASFAGDPALASSTSSGATVIVAAPGPTPGPAATATTLNPVQVNGPAAAADGPLVMDLQRFGYHSQPTVLVLTFNEGLDPSTATSAANYRIVPLGPHAKSGHAIAIDRVAYNPAARTVTLHPSHRLNVHDRFELIVDGTSAHGIVDLALQALDGGKTGKAGSDYVGKIEWAALAGPSLAGPKYASSWRKLVRLGEVRP